MGVNTTSHQKPQTKPAKRRFDEEEETVSAPGPSTKTARRTFFDEDEETRRLSTGELQRLCLLEQLKLTRLQIEYYQNKMKKPTTDTTTYDELEGRMYTTL